MKMNRPYQVGTMIDEETRQLLDYIGNVEELKVSEVIRKIIQCAIVDSLETEPDYEYHTTPIQKGVKLPYQVKSTLTEKDHTNFIDLVAKHDTTISKCLRSMIAVQSRDYVLDKRQQQG